MKPNTETLFPHKGFPIRIDYKDGKDKRICWFECEEHYIKYVERYKLKEKDYELTTDNLALVGQSSRRKGTQKRSRSGQSSSS